MSETIRISKIEAAKVQIVAAIRLYFYDQHPAPIHTLAAAACGILRDLDSHGAKTGLWIDSFKGRIQPGFEGKWHKIVKKAENFFKHANNDPDGILEYRHSQIDVFIFAAIEKYREITHANDPEMITYLEWFILCQPEVIVPEARERFGLDPVSVERHRNTTKRTFFEETLPRVALGLARLKPLI
jgi:hypothetical protein